MLISDWSSDVCSAHLTGKKKRGMAPRPSLALPPASTRLRQQALDLGLGFLVVALAKVPVHNEALLVDQVRRRPVLIAVGVPGGVAIVLRHPILDEIGGASVRVKGCKIVKNWGV